MHKLFSLIISVLLVSVPQFSLAQYKPIKIEINQNQNKGRPKAPGRQRITCEYDGASIEISFLIPEGNAFIEIVDIYNDEIIDANFNTDKPYSIYIGASNQIEISIYTEKGNSYTGSI
mgnify:CR=1 FL=1